MKTLVIGLGYVGLPLAVRAAEAGHYVVGVDLDKRKVDSLWAGLSYIEDVTDNRLRNAVESTRLVFNSQVLSSHGEFDIAVVTVPTPLKNGEPDLSYVVSAGESLGRVMQPGCTVVLESTTYPGSTEGVFAEAIKRTSGLTHGTDYHLGFSPERIDPGASHHTLENTPKLVSGTTDKALRIVQEFYDTIVQETVPVSTPRVAEMTKVFENLQAYVNIALVNELAEICNGLDINVHEVIDAAMTKGHSVARWVPGPGVGGHCLPIDSLYVAWQAREELGRPFKIAELAAEINEGRPGYVVQRAISMLHDRDIVVPGASVLVVGLAYKPEVGDLRESPAIDVVHGLVNAGIRVTVLDPLVHDWTETPTLNIEDLPSAVRDFDLVVVTTHHSIFDYSKIATEAQQVLDCRNSMRSAENVVAL